VGSGSVVVGDGGGGVESVDMKVAPQWDCGVGAAGKNGAAVGWGESAACAHDRGGGFW